EVGALRPLELRDGEGLALDDPGKGSLRGIPSRLSRLDDLVEVRDELGVRITQAGFRVRDLAEGLDPGIPQRGELLRERLRLAVQPRTPELRPEVVDLFSQLLRGGVLLEFPKRSNHGGQALRAHPGEAPELLDRLRQL